MSSSLLKIGLVGLGKFGAFITDSLATSSAVKVVAVADKTNGLKPETLFADPTIDAIHIATPPDSHAQLAMAALQAGKHVLIEKPLALTPSDAAKVIQTAQTQQRLVGVNYIMRYNPIIQALRTLHEAKAFGQTRTVRITNIAQRFGPPTHWFWDIKRSGGIHIEHGVHFFDAVSHILQRPARQTQGQLLWREGANTDATALVQFEGGVWVDCYHAFVVQPENISHTDWQIVWDRALGTIDGWIPLRLTINAELTSSEAALLKQLGFELAVSHNVTTATLVLAADKQTVYAECIRAVWDNMAAAIRGEAPLKVAGNSALGSLDIAYQASQQSTTLD